MGIFAALMTYLVAVTLLVGGMVTGFTVLFSQPSDAELAEKPRPALIRAADRKVPEPPKVIAPPQPAAATSGQAVNPNPMPMPADPAASSNAERTKQQLASQPVRKKKAAKPAAAPASPLEPHTATLGYGPSEWPPRKFVFPLDPGW